MPQCHSATRIWIYRIEIFSQLHHGWSTNGLFSYVTNRTRRLTSYKNDYIKLIGNIELKRSFIWIMMLSEFVQQSQTHLTGNWLLICQCDKLYLFIWHCWRSRAGDVLKHIMQTEPDILLSQWLRRIKIDCDILETFLRVSLFICLHGKVEGKYGGVWFMIYLWYVYDVSIYDRYLYVYDYVLYFFFYNLFMIYLWWYLFMTDIHLW